MQYFVNALPNTRIPGTATIVPLPLPRTRTALRKTKVFANQQARGREANRAVKAIPWK